MVDQPPAAVVTAENHPGNPAVLFGDEAGVGIAQQVFFNAISKRSVNTILVTHDINEALYLAEEIFVMKDGKCTKSIEQNDLFGREKEQFPLEYNEAACLLKEQV